MNDKYVIGIDFGTDSVRAILINAMTGHEVANAISEYSRWKKRLYCDASISQFRQHPLDYLESMENVLEAVMLNCSQEIKNSVRGISVDTTGSTPVAVDAEGRALATLPEFESNPNAMFILWKDHTANAEAEEINRLAATWSPNYTKFVGGVYSSEWFWAKILHILRIDKEVTANAYSWMEHCDWISAELAGVTNLKDVKRSRCAAGHKALWHKEFDGLPSEEFLTTIDPLLKGLRDRLYSDTYTADESFGLISEKWATKLGLSKDVVIGVGAFDAHMGAVGAMIEPYVLCKVIGTSTCDMLVAPNDEVGHLLIKGICGQVDGSIVPGMLGMEAGQSAFGDIFAWFAKLIMEPVKALLGEDLASEMENKIIPYLAEKAKSLPVTENDIIAVDWLNGRRTPDANHTLQGSIFGLDLGANSISLFKSLVESTAFGSKSIVDRFRSEGVAINEVIAIGGVARKSEFVMQILSDVLNMPIKVATADQACALGSAMFASVVSEIHPNLYTAQKAMGGGFDKIFYPRNDKNFIYEKLYLKYLKAGSFIEKVYMLN